jgi:hypothetical protein
MIISAVDMLHDPDSSKAQAAREWFAVHGPADVQPLPLGYSERERCQGRSGAHHILKWFARSLAGLGYDVELHPKYDEFASGVMNSEFSPDFIKNDPELKKRFPPCPLKGLGPGLVWRAPKRPRGRPRRVVGEQHDLSIPREAHRAVFR